MGSNARAAQSLLNICRNTHDACAKDHGDNANRLPLLLIDIGLGESDTVRLVHRDEARGAAGPASVRWATFSYPRDSNAPWLGTKKETTNHKKYIDMGTLPRPYRETAKIARSLGLRYLWIDKFCAWEEEEEGCSQGASRWIQRGTDNIADIFEYAEVNIAVGVAPNPVQNGDAGLGRTNTPAARSTRYSADGLPMTMSLSHFVRPLLSDPWAFQERLLSRRKLYYLDTGDFIWSCHQSPHMCSHSAFGKVWADCAMAVPKKWSEVLEAFSRCDVEDEHDQLEAIRGLVQRKEAKLRAPPPPPPRLWNPQVGHVPQDLLWLGDVTYYQGDEDVSRPAWSCSWASWFGPKRFLRNTRARTTRAPGFAAAEGEGAAGLRIRCARVDGPRVELLLLSETSRDPAAEAWFRDVLPGRDGAATTFVAAAWGHEADWQFSRPCYVYYDDEEEDNEDDGDGGEGEGSTRRRLLGRGVVDNADYFDQYCAGRPEQLSLALLVDEEVVLGSGDGDGDGDGDGGCRLRVHYGLVLFAIGPDEYERIGVFECYGEAPANVGPEQILLV